MKMRGMDNNNLIIMERVWFGIFYAMVGIVWYGRSTS